MKIKQIEELLGSDNYNGKRNHIITACPFCYKDGHFYFNIEKYLQKDELGFYVGAWDCKACGRRGNIKKLLKHLEKEYLLEEGETVNTVKLINKLKIKEQKKILDLSLPDKKLPVGFVRLKKDDYFKSRGFKKYEFEKYTVGKSVLFKFKDYRIVSIEQEGKCKGYIARSILSKQKIKEINDEYKRKGLNKKYLRYNNSRNTDFAKMLFGIDDVKFPCKTIVLCEGLFDKIRTDQALKLYEDLELKCCATFGKNLSDYQIQILKNKKIENIILIQDIDAVNNAKYHGFNLKKHFKNVSIGYVVQGNNQKEAKDLGNSTDKEIIEVFNNLKTPEEFYLEVLDKKKLS